MIVLKTPSDLVNFLSSNELHSREPVLLEFKDGEEAKFMPWEHALNSLKNECGCSLGAKFTIVALLLSIFVLIQAFVSSFLQGLLAIAFVFVAVILSAILGKSIGLLIARIKRERLGKQILQTLLSQGY